MPVAVVTDSTADVPRALAEQLGLRVVPLSVSFGTVEGYSRVHFDDEGFYAQLAAADHLPTTSQPVTAWFEEAWADAADDGAAAVVSLHVSGELSGTVERARVLAPGAPVPVHVVDSRQVSAGLALQVLAAVRTADAGADVAQVVAEVERVRDHTRTLLVVDTLEYLRRGGRLSGPQALLGSALRVRPLLGVVDGRIELLQRVRTWARARDRLVALAVEHAAGSRVDVAVGHAVAPERAQELLAALRQELDVGNALEVGIGPVVGTHTGPGTVGLALAPSAPA